MSIPAVYRRLAASDHAAQFELGRIYLSTMGTLRDPAHPQHDPDEGSATWHLPDVVRPSCPKTVDAGLKTLASAGIEMTFVEGADPSTFVAKGNTNIRAHEAYLLSFSLDSDRVQFGHHCFEIHDLRLFSRIVAHELTQLHRCAVTAGYGKVRYGRVSDGAAPLDPFFSGTKEFEHEREVRMIWRPDEPAQLRMGDLTPRLIEAPALRDTFRRLPNVRPARGQPRR